MREEGAEGRREGAEVERRFLVMSLSSSSD